MEPMSTLLLENLIKEPRYLSFIIFLTAAAFTAFCLNYKKTVSIGAARLKYIVCWALVYMLVPCVLFVGSLPVHIGVKAALISALIAYAIKSLREVLQGGLFTAEPEYEIRLDFLLFFLGLLVLIYAALFYGRGFLWDWGKHRGVLLCLYADPLSPVLNRFSLAQDHALLNARLVYYYAMYLPAVYAAKLSAFVWQADSFKALAQLLSFFFFIWNMLGMVLAVLLMPLACSKLFELKNKITWSYFYLLLIVFSNLGYWQLDFFSGNFPWGYQATGQAEYHARFGSFWKTWQWGPPQLIAALFSVVFLGLYKPGLKRFPLLLWSTFLLSTSAFVWMFSIPLLFYIFIKENCLAGIGPGCLQKTAALLKQSRAELIASAFSAFIIIMFYASKLYPEAFVINPSLSADNGFLLYLYFLLPQLLPAAFMLWLCAVNKIAVPGIVWLAMGLLVVLPLFELGFSNDLCMKGGLLLLLVVAMFCATVLQQGLVRPNTALKIVAGVFLVCVMQGFIASCLASFSAESLLVENNLGVIRQYAGAANIWTFYK